MLIEFSVGNYRSFKEKVTFSMVAANLVAKDKKLDENNVFAVNEDLKLLKSAAIYGANASGKSNLAKALAFMANFMISSSRDTQSVDKIAVEPFILSSETKDKPSFFELVFLIDGQQYRYGFEADHENIVSEWLFYIPKVRETNLFERQLNTIKMSKTYKGKGIEQRTRNNALFLSVSAQFNVEIAVKILEWISDQLMLISTESNQEDWLYTFSFLVRDENTHEIIQLIKELDLSIDNINIESMNIPINSLPDTAPDEVKDLAKKTGKVVGKMVKFIHRKFDQNGDFQGLESVDLETFESEGTRKIFALAGYLVAALKEGSSLVIDEFDARLHPLISQAIVKLFNSNETNPNNAQLIFMTHDTNLLSNKLFRRDQIWFTEKNNYGATDLYSLAEYNIRSDASFESDYIKGRYGAIPYLGDLSNLVHIHG
jgi:AAA15 family ATPase/GTPase